MTLENENLSCTILTNKIIDECNKIANENLKHLTCARLVKLALLTEIAYMKKYGKALIMEDYINNQDGYGLMIPMIYCNFGLTPNKPYRGYIQEYANVAIDERIDKIVKHVVKITANIKTSVLIEMLKLTNFIYRPEAEVNNKFINSTTDCHYVSKELIYKAFREFSFNQLRDLNQQQTF